MFILDLLPVMMTFVCANYADSEDENCHIECDKAKYFKSKKIMSASGIP